MCGWGRGRGCFCMLVRFFVCLSVCLVIAKVTMVSLSDGSMGANAATKAIRIVDNIQTILSIELLNASQALYFRSPLKTSPFLEGFLAMYRTEVPFVENDIVLSAEISKTQTFIENLAIDMEELFA